MADKNPIVPDVCLRDFEKLGREYGKDLYPRLSEGEKTIIAVGMTPKIRIDEAEGFVRNSVARCMNETFEWGLDIDRLARAVNGELVTNFSHGVCLGLMDAATEAGKMIA